MRKTLNVKPAVIVRLQDRLADRPEVQVWVEKPAQAEARPGQLLDATLSIQAPLGSRAKLTDMRTFADIDIDSDLLHLYLSTRNDSPLSRHSLRLRGMVQLSAIRILRLQSASEI